MGRFYLGEYILAAHPEIAGKVLPQREIEQPKMGIGKKMLQDFEKLGVRSVTELKSRDAQKLYEQMCKLTGTRQGPCVLDTYRCAIEQARNPDLPKEPAERAERLVVLVAIAP